MTDEEIWALITTDEPREWLVVVDGHYLTRDQSTASRVLEDAARWLAESLLWGMDYGTRRARITATCARTAERISGSVEVLVTPEMGGTDMA